jgi:hypothetical protein
MLSAWNLIPKIKILMLHIRRGILIIIFLPGKLIIIKIKRIN